MLVLRRRAGEAIVLGGDIEIEVMEISRTRVKLGVRAPRDVSVTRKEVVALESLGPSSEPGSAGRGRTAPSASKQSRGKI